MNEDAHTAADTLTDDALARRLIRNWHEVPREAQVRAPLYATHCGSLSEGTAATQLGAGVDTVAPGMRGCPYHFHHAQEEMFVVLAGQGHLRVAGRMLPLKAGDVIFIPPGPQYPHQIINTSAAPLSYLSISTQQRPEVCEYPDSDKVSAFPGGGSPGLMQRRANTLDYWDGEP